MAAAVEWQASRYDRLADPQERWAAEVLDRLAPAAERVLDAGSGSGRVTKLLCERLAAASGRDQWSVLAVDASRAMVEQARASLADYGDRVTVVQGDLLDLDLSPDGGPEAWRRPVDAIFSSAVFHWIPDHPALFACLFAALKPGGRMVAQCGGEGNVAEWERAIRAAMADAPFRDSFLGWAEPWTFAGPRETERRLTHAGFEAVNCWLEEKIVEVDDARSYLEVVALSAHLDRLPKKLHDPFVDAVLQRLREPNTLRYVRLNIEARRPVNGAGHS